MKERIMTSIVLVAVVFSFLVFASDYLFGIGVFIVALILAYEWLKLTRIDHQAIFRDLIIFIIVVFMVTQFFVYLQYIFPIFWLYAIYKLASYEYHKIDTITTNEMLIMGLFIISPFVASLYVLHVNGTAWIFMFILVITAADSGAYFTGKTIGRHKILPRLSPNKTIEGLFGGLIYAVIVAMIFLIYMNLSFGQYIYMVIVSALIAALSVIGDVFESMMKRISGIKDSGYILPGHGGVLDRLDGYMPTLPIFVLLGYLAGVFVF